MRRVLFEPEHEAFRDSARAFIAKEITPHYAQWDRAGILPRELFARAGELGLFAPVPEQFGGSGVTDFRYNTVFAEEAARAGVTPATLGLSLQSDVCMPYLLGLTTDEQQRRWLPGIADGTLMLSVAHDTARTAHLHRDPAIPAAVIAICTRLLGLQSHHVAVSASAELMNNAIVDEQIAGR
jgi:alkylation response protein AidB-like acyl-CoA dehydrogenase